MYICEITCVCVCTCVHMYVCLKSCGNYSGENFQSRFVVNWFRVPQDCYIGSDIVLTPGHAVVIKQWRISVVMLAVNNWSSIESLCQATFKSASRVVCYSVAHISASPVHLLLLLVPFSTLLWCVIIYCGLTLLRNTVGQYLIVNRLIVDHCLLSRIPILH